MDTFETISGLMLFASLIAPLYLGFCLGRPLRFGFSSVALILLCVYGAFSLFLGYACQVLTQARHSGALPSLILFASGIVLGAVWSFLLYDVLLDERTMRIKWSNLLPRGLRHRRRR